MFAFVLTTVAVIVLGLHMPQVSSVADTVRSAESSDLQSYDGDLVHAVLALVLLVFIQVLNL